MKRLGIASVALVLLSACGGADSGAGDTPTEAKATTIALVDACPKIATASTDIDITAPGRFAKFADYMTGLAGQIDARGSAAVNGLQRAAVNESAALQTGVKGQPLVELDRELIRAMGVVSDACKQLGSPLG